MSRQNNVGSLSGIDYEHDYASHHVDPFGPSGGDGAGKHNSLDAFCGESQVDKEMALGYGTNSTTESKERHAAAMEVQLSVIDVDRKLNQKLLQEEPGESKKART